MFFNLQRYIERDLEPELQHSLHSFPVTALLGPRQCGKSTLPVVWCPDSRMLSIWIFFQCFQTGPVPGCPPSHRKKISGHHGPDVHGAYAAPCFRQPEKTAGQVTQDLHPGCRAAAHPAGNRTHRSALRPPEHGRVLGRMVPGTNPGRHAGLAGRLLPHIVRGGDRSYPGARPKTAGLRIQGLHGPQNVQRVSRDPGRPAPGPLICRGPAQPYPHKSGALITNITALLPLLKNGV